MSIKIKKADEVYQPKKLKASIVKSGAERKTVLEIMKNIKVKRGMKSSDIRKKVTQMLKKLEPKAAKKYAKKRKKILRFYITK
tara:strand:- start:595 stop:843 length:249 start_codon:yes stop_codon:yes gene_type:complete